ncbi:MAG: carbon monoxide dehydrogenase subunit G [Anaerolineae bacterium]|nr:carbon monoxide dehydrogenase subunit G [Anaerolineae bacterium]
MNLSGTYTFDADQDIVWGLLMDPDVIARAMPGVDAFVPIENETDAWNAKAKINVAAVSGSYIGTIRMSEQQPPSQYRLTVNGEGQQSIIGGTVVIQLSYDADEGVTLLTWDAEANISGKLARIGQRVIKAAANMMSNRFFGNVAQQLPSSEQTQEQS